MESKVVTLRNHLDFFFVLDFWIFLTAILVESLIKCKFFVVLLLSQLVAERHQLDKSHTINLYASQHRLHLSKLDIIHKTFAAINRHGDTAYFIRNSKCLAACFELAAAIFQ